MSSQPANVNALLHAVPKLRGAENYHDWKFALGMVLRRAGCYGHITGTLSKPEKDGKEEWERAADEGLTFIGLTIDPSQYGHIRDTTDGAEAWKALADIYEKDSRATRISLKRQIYGYKHDASQPIQEYISGITNLAARLKAIKIDLTQMDITDILIFNLDDSYSSIAASLAATKGDLAVADVTGALIDEEGRRNGRDGAADRDTKDAAFHTQLKSVKCYNCGKLGHIARNCKKDTKGVATEDNAGAAYEDIDGVW